MRITDSFIRYANGDYGDYTGKDGEIRKYYLRVIAEIVLGYYLIDKGLMLKYEIIDVKKFLTTNGAVHPLIRDRADKDFDTARIYEELLVAPIDRLINYATLINGLPASVCILEPGE